jgi:tellurite resistance protein
MRPSRLRCGRRWESSWRRRWSVVRLTCRSLPDCPIWSQRGFSDGLLQALIIARMLPWIMVQPFAFSYWAFTFGLTSMAFDAMKFVERGMDGLAPRLAYATFVVANISIAIVAVGTAWLLIRGRILPAPLSTITT